TRCAGGRGGHRDGRKRASALRPAVGAAEPRLSSTAGRQGGRQHPDHNLRAHIRAGAEERASRAHAMNDPSTLPQGQGRPEQGRGATSSESPRAESKGDRLVTAGRVDDDAQYEVGLRPRALDEYIGQDRVRDNLHVSIAAARGRKEAVDHVLLYGPPGLRETTIAH